MADDKNGREDQAQNADRRQREREVSDELERGDELEPLAGTAALDAVSFPATGADVVAAVGDRAVGDDVTVAELVPETEAETFENPDDVDDWMRNPSVAAAMKRIVEAIEPLQGVSFGGSQREAYERTFRELAAVDVVENEEVRAVGDWVVERVEETEALPGSRAVRRRAAKVCRENGYEVRNDEWLGV